MKIFRRVAPVEWECSDIFTACWVEDVEIHVQAATSAALVSRWSALLTHAAATSFAASLLFEDLFPHHNHDGDLPPLGHLLSHTSPPVPVSRLPAR